MLYQCIDYRNTYYEMFTLEPDGSPVGLTSHCKLVLDQINFMIGRGQKGIFFSYDAFCKSYLPMVDHVQTLYSKYTIQCYDIGESEAEVSYDLIVFFGTFSVIEFDIPLLWRTYIVPKKTPVVFYTTESCRVVEKVGQFIGFAEVEQFERVEFDEIVTRIRPGVSSESSLKSSNVPLSSGPVSVGSQNLSLLDSHEPPEIKSVETPKDKRSTNTIPTKQMPPPKRAIQDTANRAVLQQHPTATEKKLDETSQNDLALRRKIKNLQRAGMSIRKIAKELKIPKGKVEWLLKRKPAQFKQDKT